MRPLSKGEVGAGSAGVRGQQAQVSLDRMYAAPHWNRNLGLLYHRGVFCRCLLVAYLRVRRILFVHDFTQVPNLPVLRILHVRRPPVLLRDDVRSKRYLQADRNCRQRLHPLSSLESDLRHGRGA